MCGQGPFRTGGYDPCNGAFVDLMALVAGVRSLARDPRHLRAIDRTAAEGRVRRERALGRQLDEAATDSVRSVGAG